MFLLTILQFETISQGEIVQTLELIITFFILYGIIFYLLMTAENKKYFQKQKWEFFKFIFLISFVIMISGIATFDKLTKVNVFSGYNSKLK